MWLLIIKKQKQCLFNWLQRSLLTVLKKSQWFSRLENIKQKQKNLGVLKKIKKTHNLKKKKILRIFSSFGCRCGSYPDKKEKEELQVFVAAYQKVTRDLVASGRYDTRDDFTVVDQPFFSKTEVPTKVCSNLCIW